jgi:hypothetical protein
MTSFKWDGKSTQLGHVNEVTYFFVLVSVLVLKLKIYRFENVGNVGTLVGERVDRQWVVIYGLRECDGRAHVHDVLIKSRTRDYKLKEKEIFTGNVLRHLTIHSGQLNGFPSLGIDAGEMQGSWPALLAKQMVLLQPGTAQ